MDLIKVEDGWFSYGSHRVFKNLNLRVKKGQVVFLLGPNGAGKTSLLDCILAINKLDQGRILVRGRDINSLRPRDLAKEVAYVAQFHSRVFPYKVLDIVLMGRTGYLSYIDKPDRKDIEISENALRMVKMEAFKDREYTSLSGGEVQLVVIARAIAQNSPLIIMDEPTAHLDLNHELMVLEQAYRLVKEEDKTLIITSHDPNHVYYFMDRGLDVSIGVLNSQGDFSQGPGSMLTEKHLKDLYKIEGKIAKIEVKGKTYTRIIPLESGGRLDEKD